MSRHPYVYMIAWTKLPKIYIGVRYGDGCNPNDLWKTYFTSSRYVAALREEYGDPDVVETFPQTTKEAAIEKEKELLKEFILDGDLDVFLNRNVAGAVIMTDEIKAKIGAANKGRLPSMEHRAKRSASLKGRVSPYKGKVSSAETRAKISAAKKGKAPSAETRAKLSASLKGKCTGKKSEETRQRMSAAKKRVRFPLGSGAGANN